MKIHLPHLGFIALLFTLVNLPIQKIRAQQWDTLAPIPAMFTFPVVAVADGKIHIMGGGGVGGATDLHYAYDPATNTWESKAPVPYRAQQPAGATVNGKIHFFGGGFPNSGTPLDDHYVYDPATDTWAQAADLTVPRAIHYAVGLNEILYSLAGQGVTNLCQTYDEENDVWITKNNLPDNSFWYGAHVVTNGKIYRFCGGGYTAPVNKVHEYNPATDTWSPLPNFPNAVHAIKGAAIGDKIFLAGGYFDFTDRDEVWIFDVNTHTYTPGLPLPLGRSYHNVVAIDSCIYSVGGHHAIDETVPFSLLRWCPYENVTSVRERSLQESLNARYQFGEIIVEIPKGITTGKCNLGVYDMEGRQVLAGKYFTGESSLLHVQAENLPAGIYVVQLRTGEGFYAGKILVTK